LVAILWNHHLARASKTGAMEAVLQVEQATSSLDDAELVRLVQSGQAHAYAHLVRRYQDRIYNTCRRISSHDEDARDLAQETFLKAFRGLSGFEFKSGFYTWVYRIAVNLSLTHRRRAKLRVTTSLDESPGDVPLGERLPDKSGTSPLDRADANEMGEVVSRALDLIDKEHRAVVVLRDMEGLNYAQMAEVLEIPVGTVKSRVSRARAALRGAVEGLIGGSDRDRERCDDR
jgi:RNA polymerase sigma-70 factor, ECF subfamily